MVRDWLMRAFKQAAEQIVNATDRPACQPENSVNSGSLSLNAVAATHFYSCTSLILLTVFFDADWHES